MNRFHIVVFNYERIESFLKNFDKIRNFRPLEDRILIFDCSDNHQSQKQAALRFVNEKGWTLGKEIQIISRKNWGIDQGARIDYLSRLRETGDGPRYIWQFQEHYLDLHSHWSVWPEETPKLGGQLKNDTIPDNVEMDLDECERIYAEDPAVSIIYADRGKLGIFSHEDGTEWFYAGGANFSVRTADAIEAFRPDILNSYKAVYDGTYEWALFMELDIGRQLTRTGRDWYDLVTHHQTSNPLSLRNLEAEKQISLHQSAEPFYHPLYCKYKRRFNAVLCESPVWRKLHVFLSLWYVDLLASGSIRKLKRVLEWMGLALLAKRMRHYLAGVLRQE
ncbi:MAG TPA: hypothetical protein VGQ39_22595 [Pyrinomonadaceae bacterium]|jgi:hypothetical protein|nr:hypothetical protein [Pyrinomonadaceae bacterium]